MNAMSRRAHWWRLPAALLLSAALSACIAEGSATRNVAELTGFATTPQPSKPFVQQSRPGTIEYIPVGTTVSRKARQKTPEEFKALEAQLEAKRLSNEAAGNHARVLGATQAPPPAQIKLPE